MLNYCKVIAVFWLLLIGTTFGKFEQPPENAYGDFFSEVAVLYDGNDLKTSINARENWFCNYSDVQNISVYTYVKQNPWTFFDPYGLNALTDYMGEVGGALKGTVVGGGKMLWGSVKSAGKMVYDVHPIVNGVQLVTGTKTGYQKRYESGKAKATYNLATSSEARAAVVQQTENYLDDATSKDSEHFAEKINGPAIALLFETAMGAKGMDKLNKLNKLDDVAQTTGKTAQTIAQQSGDIADNAIVHFGPNNFNTIKPGEGGDYFSAFLFGDIKKFTQSQVEGLIGPLAQSGQKGGSRVMHVVDDTAKAEELGNVPSTKVPEYTVRGEQKVDKYIELESE